MKIPVAEKIGLDSVALDGHQGLETIPNKPSITFSGSLMIQVESKHRSCQMKTFRPKTRCSSFHVGVDDIGGPHPRHERSRKAAGSNPHGGYRIGVQQPVMGVKADQRAQGGEIHLTVGHAAGGAFLPVPESRFQLRGELLNPAINAGMSTSTPRSVSISSRFRSLNGYARYPRTPVRMMSGSKRWPLQSIMRVLNERTEWARGLPKSHPLS